MNKSYAALALAVAISAADITYFQALRRKNKALVKLTRALFAQNENLIDGLYDFDKSVEYMLSQLENPDLPVDEFDTIIQNLAVTAKS